VLPITHDRTTSLTLLRAYCSSRLGTKLHRHILTKAQVKYLEKWLQCQYSCPQQIPPLLLGPFPQVVQTTTFNFTNQLFTLISDQVLFGNLDNLDVNVDDPFGKYVPPNGLLSTVDSGQWYSPAYRHEVKDPSKDFMMPISFA
jgi:hypothetical protein